MTAQQRTIHTQVPTQTITIDVTPDRNNCCWVRVNDPINFAALLGWEQWDIDTDKTKRLLAACNHYLDNPTAPPLWTEVATYQDFTLQATNAPDAGGNMQIHIGAEWRFRNIESLRGGLMLHLNRHHVRRLKAALDEFFTNLQNGVYSD